MACTPPTFSEQDVKTCVAELLKHPFKSSFTGIESLDVPFRTLTRECSGDNVAEAVRPWDCLDSVDLMLEVSFKRTALISQAAYDE